MDFISKQSAFFRYFGSRGFLRYFFIAIKSKLNLDKGPLPDDDLMEADLINSILRFSPIISIENFGLERRIGFNYLDNKIFVNIRRRTTDASAFNNAFVKGQYKQLLKRLSPNDTWILDLGANIGSTSIYLKAHRPDLNIVLVEPDSQNCSVIKKNIASNSWNHSMFLVEGGVWVRDSPLAVHTGFRDGRNWAFQVEEADPPEMADCQGFSIAHIMEKYKINKWGAIKMDIEGTEKYLFEDKRTAELIFSSTNLIAIEIHDEIIEPEFILSQAKNHGFQILKEGENHFFFKN